MTLASLRGKVVLASFWASWCPPCRRDASRMEAVWAAWGHKGVVVLGVDTQEDAPAGVAFARQHGLTFPVVSDSAGRAFGAFGLMGLPEAFLIDRSGRVRVHWIGEITAADLGSRIVTLVPSR